MMHTHMGAKPVQEKHKRASKVVATTGLAMKKRAAVEICRLTRQLDHHIASDKT